MYWSFSFSISPSNEYPGLISFRMDWFDLLAILGILKSPYPETNYSGKEYVKMCVCVCVAEARCHIAVVKETVNRLYLNFFFVSFFDQKCAFLHYAYITQKSLEAIWKEYVAISNLLDLCICSYTHIFFF